MSNFERLFDFYLESIFVQGEKFAKIKTLTFALNVLEAWRRITNLLFISFLAAIVFTASCFSALFYNLRGERVEFDLFNISMILIGLTTLSFLFWSSRQKRWLDAFAIQQVINKLNLQSEQNAPNPPLQQSLAPAEIEKIIENIVEKSLEKKLETMKKI